MNKVRLTARTKSDVKLLKKYGDVWYRFNLKTYPSMILVGTHPTIRQCQDFGSVRHWPAKDCEPIDGD